MWNIRPTIPTDVPGILALVGGIYVEYGCAFNPEVDDPFLLDPGPYFRTSGGEFWVAVSPGGAASAAPVVATGAVKLHADAGELKTLYVHPSVRRQGLARTLTAMAIHHARDAGRTRFFLWTDTRFVEAHQLYASLGFVKFGERDLGDSNNSREYGMELRPTGA
jgi:putative acetyltransferase